MINVDELQLHLGLHEEEIRDTREESLDRGPDNIRGTPEQKARGSSREGGTNRERSDRERSDRERTRSRTKGRNDERETYMPHHRTRGRSPSPSIASYSTTSHRKSLVAAWRGLFSGGSAPSGKKNYQRASGHGHMPESSKNSGSPTGGPKRLGVSLVPHSL